MDTWTDRGAGGGGSLRGARAVGRALRGHVITGNLGGEGGREEKGASAPSWAPARYGPGGRWMPDRGGGRRASVYVCLFLQPFTEERRGGGSDCFGQLWLRRLFFFFFLSLSLLLDFSSSPTPRPRRAGPLSASLSSSLGLLGTRCCLSGQGLRRCGCLSPLAALPLLATRSWDWSGDLLAQTDSERATAYALPHRGYGRAGVQGQGGDDGEDGGSETVNLGKVQGLCRFPQGRRGEV